MIVFFGLSSGYRAYLHFESESIYSSYGSTIDDGLNKHNNIEKLDNQKPVINIPKHGFNKFQYLHLSIQSNHQFYV